MCRPEELSVAFGCLFADFHKFGGPVLAVPTIVYLDIILGHPIDGAPFGLYDTLGILMVLVDSLPGKLATQPRLLTLDIHSSKDLRF